MSISLFMPHRLATLESIVLYRFSSVGFMGRIPLVKRNIFSAAGVRLRKTKPPIMRVEISITAAVLSVNKLATIDNISQFIMAIKVNKKYLFN